MPGNMTFDTLKAEVAAGRTGPRTGHVLDLGERAGSTR